MQRQRGELVGLPEPARKRNCRGQAVLRLLRQVGEQRRQEQSGRDGQHTNAELRQFARDRQGHRNDAAFGRRIGRLPDLAVIGRDRRRGDHHAALAGCERFQLRHFRGRQPQHVERADQIDLDHSVEIGERHRALAADHPLGDADAGAIHQHPRRAMGLRRRDDGGLGGGRVGDIADHRDALDLSRNAFGERGIEIAHGNPRALRCEPACGRGAQSRCAAGNDGRLIFQLHGFLLAKLFFEVG